MPTTLDLLKDSYKELLDATKHQDDKVGRLLTATAFLAAAGISIANLSGSAVHAPLKAGASLIPSVLEMAIVPFLLLVALAAVSLIHGLSTPVRIPSFSAEGKPHGKPAVSQLFFFDIARYSLHEWQDKWGVGESARATLTNELGPMYVRETHNLAIRADFKYHRTREAVAILNLAILFFGASVVLAISATGYSGCTPGACPELTLGAGTRFALGLYAAGWVLIALLTQFRNGRLDSKKLVRLADWESGLWRRATAGRSYVALSSLIVMCAIWRPDLDSPNWLSFAPAAIGFATLATQLVARFVKSQPWRERRAEEKLGATIHILMNGTYVVLATASALTGQYGLSLAAATAIPVGLSLTDWLSTSSALSDRATARLDRGQKDAAGWHYKRP